MDGRLIKEAFRSDLEDKLDPNGKESNGDVIN